MTTPKVSAPALEFAMDLGRRLVEAYRMNGFIEVTKIIVPAIEARDAEHGAALAESRAETERMRVDLDELQAVGERMVTPEVLQGAKNRLYAEVSRLTERLGRAEGLVKIATENHVAWCKCAACAFLFTTKPRDPSALREGQGGRSPAGMESKSDSPAALPPAREQPGEGPTPVERGHCDRAPYVPGATPRTSVGPGEACKMCDWAFPAGSMPCDNCPDPNGHPARLSRLRTAPAPRGGR